MYAEMEGTTEDEAFFMGYDIQHGQPALKPHHQDGKRHNDRDEPATSQAVFSALPEVSTRRAAREQFLVRTAPNHPRTPLPM